MSIVVSEGFSSELLQKARGGDASAAGRLLEPYRRYLQVVAGAQIERAFARRSNASDLVQETFLDAHRDLASFRGTTESEFLAWLRKVLCRNIVDQVRHHGAQRRDWRRDGSFEAMVKRSSAAIHEGLVRGIKTPGEQLVRQELAVQIAEALDQLKPEYREVIVLRNLLGLTHPQVAERIGRSEGAARMLWTRALEALRHALKDVVE